MYNTMSGAIYREMNVILKFPKSKMQKQVVMTENKEFFVQEKM